MKCTYKTKCNGNETGKDCPPKWIKHKEFSPIVLWIFFQPINIIEDPSELDFMVCKECMKDWETYKSRSLKALKAAKKRRNKI